MYVTKFSEIFSISSIISYNILQKNKSKHLKFVLKTICFHNKFWKNFCQRFLKETLCSLDRELCSASKREHRLCLYDHENSLTDNPFFFLCLICEGCQEVSSHHWWSQEAPPIPSRNCRTSVSMLHSFYHLLSFNLLNLGFVWILGRKSKWDENHLFTHKCFLFSQMFSLLNVLSFPFLFSHCV